MDDLEKLLRRIQYHLLKARYEILMDDYDSDLLYERIKYRLQYIAQLRTQLSYLMGDKHIYKVSDEDVKQFINDVRKNYTLLFYKGRFKVVKRNSKAYKEIQMERNLYGYDYDKGDKNGEDEENGNGSY